MRLAPILLLIIFVTSKATIGQISVLNQEQRQSIQRLINTFRTKNDAKIADLIYYLLRREYPLRDVKDKQDCVQRFDEIFDEEFVDHVANSKMSDWSGIGLRRMMLDDGSLWIDDDGEIITVNYQSRIEKQLLGHAIQADKNLLPKSLRDFEKPFI